MKPELVTFDCYGTLIDWKTGVQKAVGSYIREEAELDAFFDAWWRTDRIQTRERHFKPYREILRLNFRESLNAAGIHLTETEIASLTASLPEWPLFEDTALVLTSLKEAGFRIGILSNIDIELLARTLEKLEVEFDLLITAEELHAYKPALEHFRAAIERGGTERERIVHVAASRVVDIEPAHLMRLNTIYVNRAEPDGGISVFADHTVANLREAADVIKAM